MSHIPNISNETHAPMTVVINTGSKEVPKPIEWTPFLFTNATKNVYLSDMGIEKRSTESNTNFELVRHHNTNKCSSTNSSVENRMLEDDIR